MPGPAPCESPATTESLGACGDGLGIYEADSDGTYVVLNSNREMRASLYGARFVTLDFSQGIDDTALCGTGCFLNFDGQIIMTDGTVMQTNVVDAAGNEVTGGLMSLQPNEQKDARFFFTFNDSSGRDFHWSLRYYPELYPGSDYARVTRIGECTWTIQSQGGHGARLHAVTRRHRDPGHCTPGGWPVSYRRMADDPHPLALFKKPVPIDDDERLWLSANFHDWAAVVQEHALSVVIDLEQDLDRGIPDHPDSVIYVYFPIRDEGLPPLPRLHAVAQLGSDLLRQGERVLVHCEMGLNRSALLAGLILVHGGASGEAAFERLQLRRPGALFNVRFSEYLRRQPRGGRL